MFTVVVRQEPDKGYYFSMHDSNGMPVAVSRCWASKGDCRDYVRAFLPSRVCVEDLTLDVPGGALED